MESNSGDEVQDDVPLVSVEQGLIQGIRETSLNGNEFYSYMSIPYAEPPIGILRFKDPVPAESWEGVLDGTKMPSHCLQQFIPEFMTTDKDSTILTGKEDCLYLNVFTPAPNENDRKLAVMVFIHGGGSFIVGGTQDYPPHVLMNKDIVLVTVQYRLGIFGFLSTEDSIMPGNLALKDQQLALKWVQENIASFGGDPDTVTIFGHGSGGASVHYHVLSPGSEGLFKRAIIQSGSALCPWASNEEHKIFAEEAGRKFNCDLNLGTETFLECMQQVNPHFLVLEASSPTKFLQEPRFDRPRMDGEFISDAPEILMKEEKFNKVDLMMGVTRDEGAFNLIMLNNPSLVEKLNENFSELGVYTLGLQREEDSEMLTREIYERYLQRESMLIEESDQRELLKLYADAHFVEAHDSTLQLFAKADVNLYSYQLNHFGQSSIMDLLPNLNRSDLVSHCDDLAYLFEGKPFFPKPMENEEDLQLREIILTLWTNFAKTGDPNSDELDFTWEKTTTDNFQHLSLTPNPSMEEDNFSENREFWSSLKTKRNFNLQNTENEDE